MSRVSRKLDHIQFSLETGQLRNHGFDDIVFVHQSLPEVSLDKIDISTKIGELSLRSPIFINAMTGGGGEETFNINDKLSSIAHLNGLAMAVGSQMSAIRDRSQAYTYKIVRKNNPNGIVVANLGFDARADEAEAAVELLEADAMQVHINVVQELVMPEGDRNFEHVLKNIEQIANRLSVPIIVKEVGFGISRETSQKLFNAGVKVVDVGGYGGTNFAKIENKRRDRMFNFFNDWGITTTASIAEVARSTPLVSIIGSGGIQSALEIAKSIALGASACGVAGYFLKILLQEGDEALDQEIKMISSDLRFIMTALGVSTIQELQKAPLVIKGDTHHWLTQRKIDTLVYSNR
ncbi:type 2 isopentenyl-diphosphate Delta-isomerase [Bacillus sp. HMF5848]|uniref:type 2 isopentenyl-diphosphate Delta-isomerase n=1 Tax=Bacillus sp. HMF5848 TaxID=2495421 RepID=UPI000F7AA7ED|nr:type 2 isopentenyl-diphosphate Delta-isomerase [Bacillus sp. HMF5848]RSK27448.1 type 2 isopentenyl-diphosphate Delta-isomerase [Bacillus sp. HMF5848]